MELYILDNLLRRETVVDRYESLIWTERFRDIGDFDLSIDSSRKTRNMFNVGDRLALNESFRVMTVDNIDESKDSEGRNMLNITGKSIENTMDDRVATLPLVANGETPNWVLTGTPGDIARQIFKEICIDGKLHPGDIIPFIDNGSSPRESGLLSYPKDTILEPDTPISMEVSPGSVLEIIKQICDIYELGFRIARFADNGKLYFEIYAGSDRTTQQSTLPPVLFSPDLNNLSDISKLTSVADFKNTAYVFSEKGSLMVYGDNVDPNVSGFERRVLKVDATDLGEATGTELTNLLKQRGKEALSEHRSITAFDGKIPENGSYRYGKHYQLGDLVEMRNEDGGTNNMRVAEQIFASDAEGERSYPTLAFDLYITPGSWRNWDYNQVWNTATKVWEEA